jgi:hypothetical protein
VPKEQPLWYKLYYLPQYYELARILGYEGLPAPEAVRRAKPLLEKYGKSVMDQVSRDIVQIDGRTNPPTARLRDEARKLCRQLLGPPPETAAEGSRLDRSTA